MEAEERWVSVKNLASDAFWGATNHQFMIHCVAWIPLATLPDDIAALKAALLVERANALEVAAELAVARPKRPRTWR